MFVYTPIYMLSLLVVTTAYRKLRCIPIVFVNMRSYQNIVNIILFITLLHHISFSSVIFNVDYPYCFNQHVQTFFPNGFIYSFQMDSFIFLLVNVILLSCHLFIYIYISFVHYQHTSSPNSLLLYQKSI